MAADHAAPPPVRTSPAATTAGAPGLGTGPAPIDLSVPLRLHIVGVGGSGMGAIATVLAAMGHRVSGSDLRGGPVLERLRGLGVDAVEGHAAANVGDVDAVAISTAVPRNNPEVAAARERGIPVLRRAEILAALTAVRPTAAVAGTHGKTTTSSMLTLVLRESGMDPSFIIGGELNQIGSGAGWHDGEWFVVEADESDGTFVELHRSAALVTNVEPDHLEHYGGFAPLEAAFEQFLCGTVGPRVVCADDPGAASLGQRCGATTYGTSDGADYRMTGVRVDGSVTAFAVEHHGQVLTTVELPVPGLHNARNACGALALAVEMGADPGSARRALARFGGVARRYEFRGEAGGTTFVDDYAHLPTEVDAALEAATSGGWSRVVCVFQPHRYSRTESLWQDFGPCFSGADVLAVTDVYPSGEAPRPGVSGKLIVDAVLAHRPWRRVAWLPKRSDVVTFLRQELRPGDLCLTLGAGDLTTLPTEVLAHLAASTPADNPTAADPGRTAPGGLPGGHAVGAGAGAVMADDVLPDAAESESEPEPEPAEPVGLGDDLHRAEDQ